MLNSGYGEPETPQWAERGGPPGEEKEGKQEGRGGASLTPPASTKGQCGKLAEADNADASSGEAK